MIKSELIDKLAKRLRIVSDTDVENCINGIIEQMSQALGSGHRIEVRGFGSFNLHYRPPRNAHNPKTGQKVFTEPKYIPHFKPGKDFRERVNNVFLGRKNPPLNSDNSGNN
ncbi:MAG: ihfB [Gammaproteobacteria bacterium]|jgi:integration host factor subunit beta|nr:ihfB [Gammaproteobacteria bacterium]